MSAPKWPRKRPACSIEGVEGINPVNDEEIPIFVSDYVLMSYGTGAIMAVPAHDTRDWEFAKKFNLPIIEVVKGGDVEKEAFTDCATGIMVNSGILNGLSVEDAKKKIIEWLEQNGKGHPKVNFKLRDWVFSRQRYWGEPIPMVYCEKCGWVPLPESELPLQAAGGANPMSRPTTDESPLAKMTDWVNTTCPHCGGPAKRETDTMPQWAGSSWYFLRYCDPHNDECAGLQRGAGLLDARLTGTTAAWSTPPCTCSTPASGTSSCTTSALSAHPEPYAKRTSHGMILGENGEKMSKSRGNVVNPDDIVREYGADTMRLYEMFIGDFEKSAPVVAPPPSRAASAFWTGSGRCRTSSYDGEEYLQGAGECVP